MTKDEYSQDTFIIQLISQAPLYLFYHYYFKVTFYKAKQEEQNFSMNGKVGQDDFQNKLTNN